MEYLLVCIVALLGSGLTFFSGFGLGTLLTPVFAIFFPLEMAIAITAIVHFLNNLFKLTLLRKNINKKIAWEFGVPALLMAFAGAYTLMYLSDLQPLFEYKLLGRTFWIMPINLIIACLLIFFSLFEIVPYLTNLKFSEKYIVLGGSLSGFFGGLSGTQGALRSAFLLRTNLSKEEFIATGVAIACMIDVSRLVIYGSFFGMSMSADYSLIIAATLSAFVGAYFGNKLLKKITIKTLQLLVAVFLCVFAVLLGAGIV